MKVFVTGATGYIGGAVAIRLIEAGHQVRGLVRAADRAEAMRKLGVEPVIGSLEDADLLTREARQSDGVISTANADDVATVKTFIAALEGTGKLFIHTSGSSIIGDDARGNTVSGAIYDEYTPFVVAPLKQPRRDIELMVLAASERRVRSIVISPTNIYGRGRGLNPKSIQIPVLIEHARKTGVVHVVGKGVNLWSNVHIDDVAAGLLMFLGSAVQYTEFLEGYSKFLRTSVRSARFLSDPEIYDQCVRAINAILEAIRPTDSIQTQSDAGVEAAKVLVRTVRGDRFEDDDDAGPDHNPFTQDAATIRSLLGPTAERLNSVGSVGDATGKYGQDKRRLQPEGTKRAKTTARAEKMTAIPPAARKGSDQEVHGCAGHLGRRNLTL